MKSLFDFTPKKARKRPANDPWILSALQKQSALILDAIKEMGGKPYMEQVLKHLNSKGHDFEKCHIMASLKYLTENEVLRKETRDRVAYYEVR